MNIDFGNFHYRKSKGGNIVSSKLKFNFIPKNNSNKKIHENLHSPSFKNICTKDQLSLATNRISHSPKQISDSQFNFNSNSNKKKNRYLNEEIEEQDTFKVIPENLKITSFQLLSNKEKMKTEYNSSKGRIIKRINRE